MTVTNMRRAIQDVARSAIRGMRRTRAYALALDATDRVVVWVYLHTRLKSRPLERSTNVVLCPPGSGNIGDQAMFEAYLDMTPGRIVAVTSAKGSMTIPARHQARVTEAVVPGITGSGPILRFWSTLALANLLGRAITFAVVGADIMDGRYNLRSSLGRISSMRAAVSLGVPTRVLGFSWSDAPESAAAEALRGLGDSVRLLARDPRSARRLRETGMAGIEEVSDIVFSASRVQDPSEKQDVRGPYIVVNASGLIPYQSLRNDYGAIFDWAHGHDIKVVVLPHVIRPGADDGPVCTRMFREFSTAGDVLIQRTLAPDEVRALVDGAEFVLTGRMHLAIMSLSRGTPAATLSTVGKVEGLYDLFALPQLAVVPEPGFSKPMMSALADRRALKACVLEKLPAVRTISRLNAATGAMKEAVV